MTNQIEVVKAEDFGLDVEKANQISQAFSGKIAEREILAQQYQEIIKLDIDDIETVEKAHNLRRQLVKIRTGIANIHKVEKQFYLAAGKYVDAWKNKETLPVTMMEDKLKEIETYAERKEQERIDKQQSARMAKLKLFVSDDYQLNPMLTNEEFEDLLAIKEKQYNDRIAAEAEIKRQEELKQVKETTYRQRREELLLFGNPVYLESLTIETTEDEYLHLLDSAKEEKKEKEFIAELKDKRTSELLPFGQFIESDHKPFEQMNDKEWNQFKAEIVQKKEKYDDEQEQIRIENERIRKEQEDKAKATIKTKADNKTKASKFLLELKFKFENNSFKFFFDTTYFYEIAEDLISDFSTDTEFEQFKTAISAQIETGKAKAQLRAKEAEELRQQKEKEQEDLKAKEAERLAELAPEKEKIQKWIESIELPDINSDGFTGSGQAVVHVIKEKFEAFKNWAETQQQSIQ